MVFAIGLSCLHMSHVACYMCRDWFCVNLRVVFWNRSLDHCNGLICRDPVACAWVDMNVIYGRYPHRQALPLPPLPPLSVAARVCG